MDWKLISGTLNYRCGDYIATYVRTHMSGYAYYVVHHKTTPAKQRKQSTALCVGGLPTSLRSVGGGKS